MNGIKSLFSSNLKYFDIVYRTLSYSEAARIIPMTHQGLRKAIGLLEADIGAKLFISSDDGKLIATPAANELSSLVKGWMHDTRALEETLNQLRDDGNKTVRLMAASGVSGFLGYSLGKDFSRALPGYSLDLYEQPDFLVEEALKDGIYGIAVSVPPQTEGFEYLPLEAIESCVWMHRDNPLAQNEHLSLRDLDKQPISLTGFNTKAGIFFKEAFREQDIHPEPLVNNNEFFWNFIFALEGRGLGLGIAHIDKHLAPVDNVVSIPLTDGYIWRFGILYRQDYELTSLDCSIIDFLLKRVQAIKS